MLIKEIMTPDPIAVPPSTTIGEAAARMQEIGCRHLPIVDHEGRLVGVISDKDVLRPGTTVADVMAEKPLTTTRETPIEVAAATMAAKKISCLPVMNDGALIGIVTTYDLLDALASRLRAPRA